MYTKHPVECVHHWVFGAPKGQINIGTCKYCGERTEAVNWLEPPPLTIWKANFPRTTKE